MQYAKCRLFSILGQLLHKKGFNDSGAARKKHWSGENDVTYIDVIFPVMRSFGIPVAGGKILLCPTNKNFKTSKLQ